MLSHDARPTWAGSSGTGKAQARLLHTGSPGSPGVHRLMGLCGSLLPGGRKRDGGRAGGRAGRRTAAGGCLFQVGLGLGSGLG